MAEMAQLPRRRYRYELNRLGCYLNRNVNALDFASSDYCINFEFASLYPAAPFDLCK